MLGADRVMVRTWRGAGSVGARARSLVGWLCLLAGLAGGVALKAGAEGSGKATGWDGGQSRVETPHGAVRRYEIGQGPRSYWLFEPEQPRPERAPVVVFLHGWFAVNPGFYGAWIDHLVRDGKIVIF